MFAPSFEKGGKNSIWLIEIANQKKDTSNPHNSMGKWGEWIVLVKGFERLFVEKLKLQD
jgi:hypothetical protein